MKLSDILLLLKGKRAAVGEIRNWKGGSYIKTPTGWKPHEKQYSKKYTERKNNAATKKDTDLRKRQSEVARLSGEIQGHKAAVEHHTAQNTKQDTRQAKHHSIRAQVKQRRLDKHKEILEQRHGVKDEVVKPVKKKQFNFSKPLSLNSIQNNTWGKQPENLSNDDLLKTYAYVKYANYAIKRNLINAPTGKTHILPQVGGQDNINAFENEIKKRGLENAFEIDIDLSQYRVKSQEAKANFEKWKADRQAKSDTPKEKPEPTKSDVIQSGNRGATIAGQHFSKREVDILNSLDEIIGRAKSPVVQDLLKKRQAAKPTPKTSNLEPHESKFMELVGKNRSQADKQAGYPEERRKVEAETGVKIPREKVNDILSGKSSQVSTPKSNDKGR